MNIREKRSKTRRWEVVRDNTLERSEVVIISTSRTDSLREVVITVLCVEEIERDVRLRVIGITAARVRARFLV